MDPIDPTANPSGRWKVTGQGRGQGSTNRRAGGFRGRGGYWRGNYRGHHQSTVPREKPIGFALPSSSSEGSSPTGTFSTPSTSFATSLQNGNGEYIGWKLYFPKEDFRAGSKTVRRVRTLQTHYDDFADQYDLEHVKIGNWFELKLDVCDSDSRLREQWPSMRQDLTESPEDVLACIGLAMHQLLVKHQTSSSSQQDAKLCLQTVRPRVVGFGPEVSIGSIKVSSFGKLVSVRGTIIRAGPSQIMNTWCAFRCSSCGSEQAVQQKDGIYTTPTSCHGGCKARSNFVLLHQSVFTRMEAYQTIRLQETTQGSRTVTGSVAKNIEVELTHELVDSVCPGDDVTVTGVLKARSQDDGTAKASLYKAYIQAVYVRSNKNVQANWNRLAEFTELDMEAIRMIQSEPSPFRLLVQSLCPTIYGHEMVKAGLLLGLFGGQANTNRSRAEIHVLVVGDPGIGKSQILQSCAKVSPRGIFVCGTNSSNVGLTVTVRMEKGVGASLEAGALVLADQGVCCIDEFDKMSGHSGLLEVMEQRSVSVAKAGVICTVPARTTVLAAANPAGGHYNKAKTVSENLKLHPALLSRFDLVFILLDRSNERTDNLLTAHIQKVHGLARTSSTPTHPFFEASGCSSSDGDAEPSLEERLRLQAGEKLDLLPAELVQKYIGYARKHIQPKLTAQAAEELRDFFVELRRVHREMDMIPVTTRQLEGLIRLTQARAKIDLSSEATIVHVRDVLAILRQSMLDVFSTDEGELQFTRLTNGSGTSKTSSVRRLAKVLQLRSAATGSTVYTFDELRQAIVAGGIQGNCNELIDTLNIQGFLLKKGRDCYKFIVE